MFKQGQIWLIDFDPSVGHEYQKVRPALIIESDEYLPLGNLVTVVPISSQITKNSLLDVLIQKDTNNRLMADSLIKTRQVSTFDQQRFIRQIGVCNTDVLQKILANIALYLAL